MLQQRARAARPARAGSATRSTARSSRSTASSIAVDETPIGTFVEIEGTEAGITATAAALGRTTADYILDSYCALFLKYREALGFRGADMVFDEPDRIT